MSARQGTFYQKGVNMYVPALQYASDVELTEPTMFFLGTPALASATAIMSAVASNAVAGTLNTLAADYIADSTYGRNIVLTPSGVPGNTNIIDILGYDYLRQPMIERFTGSAAASTALVGKKAFYGVTASRIVTPASNAVTFNLGTGSILGLPYKGWLAWVKENMVPLTPSTQFTVPDLTDPATAVTGDPRGTYTAVAALDGIKRIEAGMFGDNYVNAAGNGGLHGIRHFFA